MNEKDLANVAKLMHLYEIMDNKSKIKRIDMCLLVDWAQYKTKFLTSNRIVIRKIISQNSLSSNILGEVFNDISIYIPDEIKEAVQYILQAFPSRNKEFSKKEEEEAFILLHTLFLLVSAYQ